MPAEDGFPFSNITVGILGKYDRGNQPLVPNRAGLDDKSLKELQKDHMSFINFDPFKALSNRMGSLPSFEIGRNFLFSEKVGKGEYQVSE